MTTKTENHEDATKIQTRRHDDLEDTMIYEIRQ